MYVDGTAWGQRTGTTATVTGLDAGTAYAFSVTATDAAGNESSASNTITVTTDAAGDTPLAATVDATSGSPNNPHADVEMTWQVTGAPEAVTLELYEGTDASDDASRVATWAVSASGTRTYQEKFASPKTFTAKVTATRGTAVADDTDTVSA